MKQLVRIAALPAAFLALAQPALAQGTQCVARADIADATTYAMPLVLEGLRTSCADLLPADSFIINESAAFGEKFAPLRDAAWPGARRLLVSFIESETGASREDAGNAGPDMGGVIQMLMQMEGDDLRPFVDAMATQAIAAEIKPDTCSDIEAVLPLLAPLPPENHGALISTILGMVADDEDELKICPAQ